MGLIHLPRTLRRIARGYLKGQRAVDKDALALVGMGPDRPYIYQDHVGSFDVDYLGHMNNAAYLSHAEMARWEMTAYNGSLRLAASHNISTIVTAVSIRYRKEIEPWRKFQVDTYYSGFDENHVWVAQNFRCGKTPEEQRIRTQMLFKVVLFQGRQRKKLDPHEVFGDMLAIDKSILNDLSMINNQNGISVDMDDMMNRMEALEDSMKAVAANDDASLTIDAK